MPRAFFKAYIRTRILQMTSSILHSRAGVAYNKLALFSDDNVEILLRTSLVQRYNTHARELLPRTHAVRITRALRRYPHIHTFIYTEPLHKRTSFLSIKIQMRSTRVRETFNPELAWVNSFDSRIFTLSSLCLASSLFSTVVLV